MIPVFIVAFRWGIKGGLLSGFLWGILQIAVGDAYILNFYQAVIEYGFAFTVLGFAGLFAKPVQQAVKNKQVGKVVLYLALGVFLGGLLRFASHFFAGWFFFCVLALKVQTPALFFFVFIRPSLLPALIIWLIILFFFFVNTYINMTNK